jgi:cysteinyl-tRNA synthetase
VVLQEKEVAMNILLHNTLSHGKEEFFPITAGKVTIYNCGPTVYDTPHLGNYRTFVMDDLLRRMFEYNNYEVTQVMNITDVDDKTIRRSQTEDYFRKDSRL